MPYATRLNMRRSYVCSLYVSRRFDYSVSPPPPPPIELSVYQKLADDDPTGFIEVRRRLDDLFPSLAHVATSSVGASVGPYPADVEVLPEQLTRAFLASVYMTPGSLGARVVEAKHTGAHPASTCVCV